MADGSDNFLDTTENNEPNGENTSLNITSKKFSEDSGYKSFRINITNSSTPTKKTNKKVTWGSNR